MPKTYDTHPDALARIHQLTQMLSGAREHSNPESGQLASHAGASLHAIDDEFSASSRAAAAASSGDAP
jgi:hypothetical protein